MFVDLAISTHWCAWDLGAQVGAKRLAVWCTVVVRSGRAGNRTDVRGGWKAPKEGLMGHQRDIFPAIN